MKITMLLVLAAVGCSGAGPAATSATTYEKSCVTKTTDTKAHWATISSGQYVWEAATYTTTCQMVVGTDPSLANSGCNGRPSENGPCPQQHLVGCCVTNDLGPGYEYLATCSYESTGQVAGGHCGAGETWQTTVPQ